MWDEIIICVRLDIGWMQNKTAIRKRAQRICNGAVWSRMSLDSSSCSVNQNNVSILICAPDSCQRLKSNLIACSPQVSQPCRLWKPTLMRSGLVAVDKDPRNAMWVITNVL
jgi:hypothetical protein